MLYPFGILTCWLCWLICLDWGFRCRVFSCASLIYSFEILTCWLYWLILLPYLAYWLWFCHDCSDHFTCIHSPLYITQLDMLILWLVYYFDLFEPDVCITIRLNCRILAYLVCTWWYIWALPDCVLHDRPPLRDCMSLVYVGSTSIPLSPTL